MLNRNAGLGVGIITVIFTILFYGGIFFGWSANIYKLCNYDFEPSYEAEAIRTIGIFVFPVGVIVGYIDIADKPSK